MANDISGRPWVLDTATPGSPIWNSEVKIAHMEFSGYAAPLSLAVIRDKNGKLVWQAEGAADLTPIKGFKVGWVNGLIPDTIENGGVVIVYIE